MNTEIWRHLGIAPTESEEEVRRAYADRLKVTNPEDDPDGFKRLRNAYERAMENIRWNKRYAAIEAETGNEGGEGEGVALGEPGLGGPRPVEPEVLEPVERDEVAEAHYALRRKLEETLRDNGSPWEVQAAFKALVADPAMDRLNIYDSTENWLANLVRRTSGGGPLLDLASAHFKWNEKETAVRGGVGAGMQGFRESLAEEQKARAFIARVQDKRHEFHAAYKLIAREPGNALSRLLSFPRIDLVRRFLDYVEDKVPYAEDSLSYDAIDWWRRRINFWITPLWITTWVVRVGLIIGVIALMVIMTPPSAQRAQSGNVFEKRAACVENINDIGAADGAACEDYLGAAPDSLLMRQYAGIIALRDNRLGDARAHFQQILVFSPMDPAARYGLGLALLGDPGTAEQERGMQLMREGLVLDDTVSVHFAQFGVPSPVVLAPAESYTPFPVRQAPMFDTLPSGIAIENRSAFANAYDHFGIRDQFEDGRVVVECLMRATGELANCQIVEETPRYTGRGEMALRAMAEARGRPATLNGEPIDNVPIRVPVTFRLE